MKALDHLATINHHKYLVARGCFAVGLYRQGILHDLSKYMPSEFLVGCKYYQGTMSPNNAERAKKGYSSAWLHHKGRNKHHLEYWIDYGAPEPGEEKVHKGMCGMKMPVRYVVEMYVDRVAACKNYQKDAYNDGSPLAYYKKGRNHYMLHDDTRALLELLLSMLSRRGERYVNCFIRKKLLKGEVPYECAPLTRMRRKFVTDGELESPSEGE